MNKLYSVLFLIICSLHCNAICALSTIGNDPEILLVMNQPKYIPGDTVLFAGYFMDNDYAVDSKRIINIQVVNNEHKSLLHRRFMFTDGFCSNQIVLPDNISPGVYKLISYFDSNDSDSHILGESMLVITGIREITPEATEQSLPIKAQNTSVKFEFDKNIYQTRDKVTMILKSEPLTRLTVTVIKENLAATLPIPDKLQSPTQMESNSLSQAYYFRGQVYIDSVSPLNEQVQVALYFTQNDFAYRMMTDENGYFEFPLLKPFGDELVFYAIFADGNAMPMAHIKTIEPELQLRNEYKYTIGFEDAYYKHTIESRGIMNSYQYYATGKNQNPEQSELDEAWGTADRVLELDEYEMFHSMQDVVTNIMQSTKSRQRNGSAGIRIFLKENAKFATGDPIYFINGQLSESTDLFLSLDPTKISKIGILRSARSLSSYGLLGRNGIILVKTSENVSDISKCDHCLKVTGINKSIEYITPKYIALKEKSSRIPDLRSNLYWNPEVKADQQGNATVSFFTSDLVGNYVVRITGVSTTGEILRTEHLLQVGFHSRN